MYQEDASCRTIFEVKERTPPICNAERILESILSAPIKAVVRFMLTMLMSIICLRLIFDKQ